MPNVFVVCRLKDWLLVNIYMFVGLNDKQPVQDHDNHLMLTVNGVSIKYTYIIQCTYKTIIM